MSFRTVITWGLIVAILPVHACLTPSRSADAGKKYPDWDLAKMMHEAHNQPYTGYQFNGVQTCENGMADIYPCDKVDLVGHLDLPALGGGQGSDSWGWKHDASGRYFALVGKSNGTAFVEITNPAAPVYLGSLPTNTVDSTWRDIKTYQDHAFVVSEAGNHGMQVFDLNELLTVDSPPKDFNSKSVYTGNSLGSAHNIFINEDSGFAYVVGSQTCSGGLHMVNIQNPTAPSFAGCFSADGYTHDVQCVNYEGPDTEHHGKEICFASNEDTVTVIDVTTKNNPAQLSRTGYANSSYTHQGWLTGDERYFIIDDELDEQSLGGNTRTLVMDMQDLDQPVYIGFHVGTGEAIDHNQYVLRGHTYQANYTRGLRILKITDASKAEMEEVAYFDTFPTGDGLGFPGAWNVYPFFDNGLVMVSDINRGVFILKPNLGPGPRDLIYEDGFE